MILRMLGYQAIAPALLGLAGLMSCSGSGLAAAGDDLATGPDDAAAQAIAVEDTIPASQIEPTYQQTRFSFAGELTQGGFIRGQVPEGTQSAALGDLALEIAEDGTFFAAFDRDSPSELVLSAQLATGKTVSETLVISVREWDIQHVNVAKRQLRNPEAYWRQREPEHNAIVAARAEQTGAQGWRQDFMWPLTGRITGTFGNQRVYRGEPGGYHGGIDIARPTGTPFVSPADGVVTLARTGFSLEGGLIIIDHGQGLSSAFLHAARVRVTEGQAITQGQHIGDVGSTGRSTGPHLDWRVVWRGQRFDPVLFAGPMN